MGRRRLIALRVYAPVARTHSRSLDRPNNARQLAAGSTLADAWNGSEDSGQCQEGCGHAGRKNEKAKFRGRCRLGNSDGTRTSFLHDLVPHRFKACREATGMRDGFHSDENYVRIEAGCGTALKKF